MSAATIGCAKFSAPAVLAEGNALDSSLAGATLDSAWTRVNATYYDSNFSGRDWRQARELWRPRALAARDMPELRRAIQGMMDELGQSHFAVIPSEIAATWTGAGDSDVPPGDLGIDVRLLGDEVVVSRVIPRSGAAAAGVRAGWVLTAIDSESVAGLLRRRDALTTSRERAAAAQQIPLRFRVAAVGPAGSKAKMQFVGPGGGTREVFVERKPWSGEVVQFGLLPPQLFNFEHQKLTNGEACVGLISFNTWMTPLLPHMIRAMGDLGDCSGIVIDLRGNTGGVGALVMGVSGFFVDREHLLGTLFARKATLRLVANPRRFDSRGQPVRIHNGPLAILVDRMSISTSEIFAAAMQELGRARVFGDTTPGQALPATLSRLPNDDVLMHVIADFKSASGVRLEGRGVIPDAVIPADKASLAADRDGALLAAVDWIRSRVALTPPVGARRPPPAEQ
ncbi:MAG: S41 family peptidase [Gemmatimonadota bacterium]